MNLDGAAMPNPVAADIPGCRRAGQLARRWSLDIFLQNLDHSMPVLVALAARHGGNRNVADASVVIILKG